MNILLEDITSSLRKCEQLTTEDALQVDGIISVRSDINHQDVTV